MSLHQCPLFAEFNQVELSAMKAIMQRSDFRAGACLFRENDPGDSLVFIIHGSLRISKKAPDGTDEEVAVLGSGSYLGEMALFGKGLRSTTGTALESTEAAVIPYVTLQGFLDNNPATAAKFYKAVAAGMAKRLTQMNGSVAFLKSFLKEQV